jgi:hypothetical protein
LGAPNLHGFEVLLGGEIISEFFAGVAATCAGLCELLAVFAGGVFFFVPLLAMLVCMVFCATVGFVAVCDFATMICGLVVDGAFATETAGRYMATCTRLGSMAAFILGAGNSSLKLSPMA